MSKERMLSYSMSKQISDDELRNVAAAGWSRNWCATVSGGNQGVEGEIDVVLDC